MAKTIQRSNMTMTDANGKVIRSPRDNSLAEAQSFKWWTVDEKDVAAAVNNTINFITKHQTGRIEQLIASTRLYGNSTVFTSLGGAFTRASSVNTSPMSQRLSFNVISSVVDTLTAKMAKNKVIPTFVTNGGIWKYQKKAKQLTKFAQGLNYQLKMHDMAINAFRDCAVWGDGFTHVFRKGDKVAIERVLPHEFVVDLVESMCEEPTQLHRVKIVDRDIALDLFPELEEYIMSCAPAGLDTVGGQGTAADLIKIVESWHLKSGDNANDGVRAITIGEGSIVEERDKDYFPFPHLRYSRKMLGWFSQGVPERQQAIQGEINRSMILKQKSLWMNGSFKVLIENGSKIVSQHLNNDIGAIINYTGAPPQYVTPPATNPELQQWIDSLIQKAYMQEGVSEMSAAAEKPMGVDSGKAMRTLTDIEDDRFTFVEQQVEEFVLENYRQAIEVVKEIYEDKKTYETVFPAANFLETVDWKDIDLDADCYVLRAYPTSSLSDDIAGRLSDIQELMQAGLISPRTGKRLLNMPDVEMNDSLSNAAEDLLHKVLEKIIYDQDYTPPEPSWDLQLAQQLVIEYINYATYMDAPEKALQMLDQFNTGLKDITGVIQQAQQNNQIAAQVQQQQAQAAAAPMANPQSTPTSDMLPNVNTPGVQQ